MFVACVVTLFALTAGSVAVAAVAADDVDTVVGVDVAVAVVVAAVEFVIPAV